MSAMSELDLVAQQGDQPSDWLILRTSRPLSRGVRYTLFHKPTGWRHVAYSREEAQAILRMATGVINTRMPGPKAAQVRPTRKYL